MLRLRAAPAFYMQEIRNIAIIAPAVATQSLLENPRFSTDASCPLGALLSHAGKLEFSRPLSHQRAQ